MKQEVIKAVQPIFAEYLSDYLYIDPEQSEFSLNCVSGKFRYNGARFKKVFNKILHNTEAMFIFNQVTYLLLGSIFINEGIIDANDPEQAYRRLDGIVFKNMDFYFKRSITEDEDLTFVCKAERFPDQKGRPCFVIDLDLANDAFRVSATAVCLDKCVHREGI